MGDHYFHILNYAQGGSIIYTYAGNINNDSSFSETMIFCISHQQRMGADAISRAGSGRKAV